jgi:hypothetical protein
MSEQDLQQFVDVVRHDPAVILGFAFLLPPRLLWEIQLKLSRVGRPFMPLDALFDYFKWRKQYGWAAWPGYCVWIGLPAGVAILCFALTRL